MLTVQYPTRDADFALQETIVVLAGVVVGGMTRLLVGDARRVPRSASSSGLLGGALPSDQSQYLPSFLFGLVILVLLLRPGRALHPRARPRWSAYESASRRSSSSLAPGAARRRGGARRRVRRRSATEIYFITALISVSIVVAIYVFVGNSGVLSFGHISFVAVGVWAAGVLSVPVEEKPATMPYLFRLPRARRRSGTSRRS